MNSIASELNIKLKTYSLINFATIFSTHESKKVRCPNSHFSEVIKFLGKSESFNANVHFHWLPEQTILHSFSLKRC